MKYIIAVNDRTEYLSRGSVGASFTDDIDLSLMFLRKVDAEVCGKHLRTTTTVKNYEVIPVEVKEVNNG